MLAHGNQMRDLPSFTAIFGSRRVTKNATVMSKNARKSRDRALELTLQIIKKIMYDYK